jgi:transposase
MPARRTGAAYVVTTTRRLKGRVYHSHLLRRSYRDGQQVRNETLGNLSHLPDNVIELIRGSLKGLSYVPAAQAIEVTSSRAHGHVEAVAETMKKLGLAALLAAKPCRERELVLAMVAARVLAPNTKLATTRWWHTTTLAESCKVAEATADDLYEAMDWLLARQDRIQKKLAARHLHKDGLALYDLSASYFEGSTCPLAKRGYNRDGKKGLLQVNYGLLTDQRGCPVATAVYAGNTADPETLMPELQRLKKNFGLATFVIVGDRGMISQKAVDEIRGQDGIDWITALKSGALRALIEDKTLQPELFDQRNLFEFTSPDYADERLVACRNPQLAKLRAHQRQELLAATEQALAQVQAMVAAGKLKGQDKIGLRVGRVINKYKVAKHFALEIQERAFAYKRKHDSIAQEAALDGIYVIRTSVTSARMNSAECVRSYKLLANVEHAFRSLKTIDLKIRPIHHRLADRVRAHIFLCMLAYYVEWHMRQAWRELMFADEDQEAKQTRDPVAPAQRSEAALRKAQHQHLDDGTPVHSFSTLLAELATIVRNTCRTPTAADNAPTFRITTTASPYQQRAMQLINSIAL